MTAHISSKASQSQPSQRGFLKHARNVFSQNGEDGIIDKIFSVIGCTNRACCEFGAWDGVHFANTRSLLLKGWHGVLIESEPSRFASLQETYRADPLVVCVQALVDDGRNNVASILGSAGITEELDFLSIDIDGEDFYAFSTLNVRPRLICVEVNAGHRTTDNTLVNRRIAARNIGQPLPCFIDAGDSLGYRLVCYTANAFFLRNDVGYLAEIPTLSAEAAYQQFLGNLNMAARRWLYMVNKGWVNPWFDYRNPYLTASRLKLSPGDVLRAYAGRLNETAGRTARSLVRRACPAIPQGFMARHPD